MTIGQDFARVRRLRLMRVVATGLLAFMAALYILSVLWPRPAPWMGFVRAFAEAATVGACADWFAVTALFRRPLGLPIPHTGIIPRNKDRIGAALGAFIADNFLTTDILQAKLRRLELGRWGAAWLKQPENAAFIAERLVQLTPELLALSSADARRRFVGSLAADAADAVPAAPLMASVLHAVSRGEQGAAALGAGLNLIAEFLANNQDLVRTQVASRTYRWLPKWVDEKIADSLLKGLSEAIQEMRGHDHPLRGRILDYLDGLANRLRTDPELGAAAERIKHRLLSHPGLQDRMGDVAGALESWLNPQTKDERRARTELVTAWLSRFAAWLETQDATIEIFNDWMRLAIQRSIAPRRYEIGRVIAGVVAGWDARSVAEKLELQIGADLQYIRINGTIVGGLVGLVLFTLSTWLQPHL